MVKRPTLEEVALAIYEEKGEVTLMDLFMAREAIASTAIEHPEWEKVDTRSQGDVYSSQMEGNMLTAIRKVNEQLAEIVSHLLDNGLDLNERDLDAFHAEIDTTAEMVSQIGEEIDG